MIVAQDSRDAIAAAAKLVAGHGLTTPLLAAPALSARCGVEVLIKAEHLQPTGSFKVRGALNAVMAQADRVRGSGVVTFSTGNHGRAVAWAAALIDARCTVFVSELASSFKQQALIAAGAKLRVGGAGQDEAEALARDHAASTGAVVVPPFDDWRVIHGQASVMIEIAAARPDATTVVVPISGGGLGAGTALAARWLIPSVRLVGVTMTRGAAMHASVAAGRPVAVREEPSLADSLGGGIGGDRSLTFPLVRDGFDALELVDEEAIAGAMVAARRLEGMTLEGAGATPVALLLDPARAPPSGPVVLIATGGNVDAAAIDRLEVAQCRQ